MEETLTYQDLLKARVHLGHSTKNWKPAMAPYIFSEENGIHLIDLQQTLKKLWKAGNLLYRVASTGKKVIIVGTKKQARDIVEHHATNLKTFYVNKRWLGGTLTNFMAIRRSLRKMSALDKMTASEAYKNMAKKEQLMLVREQGRMKNLLAGLVGMNKLPGALLVIDAKREHVAVSEAAKLSIPVVALVDTNTNPNKITCPIPANDDARASIELILTYLAQKIEQGYSSYIEKKERSAEKEREILAKKKSVNPDTTSKKAVASAPPKAKAEERGGKGEAKNNVKEVIS